MPQPKTYSKIPPLKPADWGLLNAEDRIYLQRENETIGSGTVDLVAADNSIFWLWLDAGKGRVAVHHEDDVRVWLEEDNL